MREHQVEGVRLLQGAYFGSRCFSLPKKTPQKFTEQSQRGGENVYIT